MREQAGLTEMLEKYDDPKLILTMGEDMIEAAKGLNNTAVTRRELTRAGMECVKVGSSLIGYQAFTNITKPKTALEPETETDKPAGRIGGE